jgi:E3 ubiquitin-protein ligase UBR4
MVDSIKVYTKTKEAFGWPEDSDDSSDSTANKTPTSASNTSAADTVADNAPGLVATPPAPLTSTDRSCSQTLYPF